MSKHTPGPWDVTYLLERDCYDIENDYGILVAEVYSQDDANLMAQAPRLLEALESAVRLLSGIEGISRNNLFALADEEIESAMAVIKAAKGE